MKKLDLKKLFVGLACLTTLVSCNTSKEECFNPNIASVWGVEEEDVEVIGEMCKGYVTFDEATKFIKKAESKGYKVFKEKLEHGVVCEKCYSWEDNYTWYKTDTCGCGGKYHDCDLITIFYYVEEFYYVEDTNLDFWVTYVNGKYSGTDEIWTQR